MTLAWWLSQSRAASDSTAIDTAAVRHAIAAVFSDPAYGRSVRETLWSRLQYWLADLVRDILGGVGASPMLRWTLIAAASLLLGGVVVRLLTVASARAHAARRPRTAASHLAADPLALARAAAAEGRFMDAAHHLYGAILDELRRSERLRLHPSKTLGEYRRDLAASSSRALNDFRRFTGLYEAVVWSEQGCDESSYQRLAELAAPFVGPTHRFT